jgi:general secretion pathway protein K
MRPPTAARGSALLVVLWVIALLSFLIVTSMMVVMQDVETVAARRLVFRARQLAEAGLAIGANPAVKPADPLLRKKTGYAESYEVNITTEEGRINLGALLTEERRGVLERIFGSWGLRPPEAQEVVDALMDWVDPDDFKRLKGAEKADYKKEGYTDRPYNRPFQSLDDVTLVRGMDLVAQANPAWREAFTLWGAGALDINEAPAELIALVADVPVSAARTLVVSRNGPDGIPHTEDDQPITSLEEAMVLLGARAGPQAGGGGLFTLQGAVVRVDSVGRAGDCTRRISVVMQKGGGGGGASPVLEWRESSGD